MRALSGAPEARRREELVPKGRATRVRTAFFLTLIVSSSIGTGCFREASGARSVSSPARVTTRATSDAPGSRKADRDHAEMTVVPPEPQAGEPAELIFQVKDPDGNDVRFLQFVHERPLHLLVVSEDLAEFAHVHPEQLLGTTYNVTHVFPRAGRYRLYANYTPPGDGALVDQFELSVGGRAAPETGTKPISMRGARLRPDTDLTRIVDGVRVALTLDGPLRAGEDARLRCAFADSATGAPVTDLQLYLGALAHFVLVSEDLQTFVHAHPLEAGEVYDPSQDPSAHFHALSELDKRLVGPSPSEVTAIASFPRPGRYKLWLQVRRAGREITAPFVLEVGVAAKSKGRPGPAVVPRDAIPVTVSAAGYEPSSVSVARARPVTLAFRRPSAENCGGTVVFPSLNLRYRLPVGETVLVTLPAQEPGRIEFTCAMGMLKGDVLVK